MDISTLKAGDKIRVRTQFGLGPMTTGTVIEAVDFDNPAIDYVDLKTNEQHWAYARQVISKLS